MNDNVIETGRTASASHQERFDARKDRFYIGFAVAVLVIVFAGFARTYYLRPFIQACLLSASGCIARNPFYRLESVVDSANRSCGQTSS